MSSVLLLEPFFAGSHRQWLEGLEQHVDVPTQRLTRAGRHWKWRMHGAAVSMAHELQQIQAIPDLLLATDMLDLATFKGLMPKRLQQVPTAVYFHENQLTYPWSETDPDIRLKRDNHYAFINYTSALAADRVWFNSAYHQQAFLEALRGFLQSFPDDRNLNAIEAIRAKSEVLPLALDLQRLDGPTVRPNTVPLIVWNHRWEYDKGPEEFFKLLIALQDREVPFEVVVLGESYARTPAIFEEAREQLGARVRHWGYCEDRAEYASWLHQADLIPVTSRQDFFGISLVEAMYCGCCPLVPNRLAFPGHIPEQFQEVHIYSGFEDLLHRSEQLLRTAQWKPETYRSWVKRYDWSEMGETYKEALTSVSSATYE